MGDCWLLSAIAVIAQDAARLRHLFAYLAVEGSRAGCIVVQLYFRNAWRRVTIDDRLPCAPDGSLLYAHSIDGNEFWVALLEKAFAKLCGSYEALISGFADSAMRTLTGGAPMRLRLRPTTPTPLQLRERLLAVEVVMVDVVDCHKPIRTLYGPF